MEANILQSSEERRSNKRGLDIMIMSVYTRYFSIALPFILLGKIISENKHASFLTF